MYYLLNYQLSPVLVPAKFKNVNKEHLAFLVNAYTENTISREAYDELMAYIKSAQTNDELNPMLQKIWDEANEEHLFDEQRQDFIFQQITGSPEFMESANQQSAKVVNWRRWLSVAAGTLLLSVSTMTAWHYSQKKPETPQPLYTVRKVPYGKKVQVQLPDKSMVWVNSGSSIKFPVSFDAHKREIYLQGEAFFDVVHDKARPFIIHTGKVSTQVLGTAFDIKAYGNTMSVTVARGKVSVGTPEKVLSVLIQDQAMNYSFRSNIASTRRVDASKLKWMNGELTFNNTSLKEAAADIERWFDVQINFESVRPKLAERRFSATFLDHENIDQVLKVLGELSGFSYQRTGKQIRIQQH